MSAQADNTSEAAEPPVEEQEREYDVTLNVYGYITVRVEAANSDDARQEAVENWREYASASDIQVDDVELESVTEA